MLSQIFKQHLYVQLSPQRLTVRDPKTGHTVSEVPEVAIQSPGDRTAKILAVGAAARSAAIEPSVKVVNPFAHPRSLVSDFTVAQHVLKVFVQRVRGQALFKPNPVVVVHPLGHHEGGLTQVELRAFRELALGAGASEVRLWQGPELTNEQVLSGNCPASGQFHLD